MSNDISWVEVPRRQSGGLREGRGGGGDAELGDLQEAASSPMCTYKMCHPSGFLDEKTALWDVIAWEDQERETTIPTTTWLGWNFACSSSGEPIIWNCSSFMHTKSTQEIINIRGIIDKSHPYYYQFLSIHTLR